MASNARNETFAAQGSRTCAVLRLPSQIVHPVSKSRVSGVGLAADNFPHLPNEILSQIIARLPYVARAQLACTNRYFATRLSSLGVLDFPPQSGMTARQLSYLSLGLSFFEVCDRPAPHYRTMYHTSIVTHSKAIFCMRCGWMGRIKMDTTNPIFAQHLKLELNRSGWVCNRSIVDAFWLQQEALEAHKKAEEAKRKGMLQIEYDGDWWMAEDDLTIAGQQ